MSLRQGDFVKIEMFKDGAFGITYQNLFGVYIQEAQWLLLVDKKFLW